MSKIKETNFTIVTLHHSRYFRPSVSTNNGRLKFANILRSLKGEHNEFSVTVISLEAVDTAGHRHGPDADETNAAIEDVDAALARRAAARRQRSAPAHSWQRERKRAGSVWDWERRERRASGGWEG